MRSRAIAVYLFVISNIGGNFSLLMTPTQHLFGSMLSALLLLYAGMYAIAAILYLTSMLMQQRSARGDEQHEPLLESTV